MISNSALMCKNSSVVCFLNHPLFKKENVPTELSLTEESSDGE